MRRQVTKLAIPLISLSAVFILISFTSHEEIDSAPTFAEDGSRQGRQLRNIQLLSNTDLSQLPTDIESQNTLDSKTSTGHQNRKFTISPDDVTLTTVCVPGEDRFRDSSLADVSVRNKDQYGRDHGFHFLPGNYSHVDEPGISPRWQKIYHLMRLLPKSRWLVWLDCDTLFINITTDIRSLMDPRYDFIVAKDKGIINSGVLLIQNTAAAMEVLTRVFSLRYEVQARQRWQDQEAFLMVLKQGANRKHFKFINHHAMNSFLSHKDSLSHLTWRPGEFIGHMVDCYHHWCKEGLIEIAGAVERFRASFRKVGDVRLLNREVERVISYVPD